MRISLLCSALALTLAACEKPTVADKLEDGAALARKQLLADDTAVCANEAVQATALSIGNKDYQSYLGRGLKPIAFTAVSAVGINKEVHEIHCKATLNYDFNSEPWTAGIEYKVRPGISNGEEFVAEILWAGAVGNIVTRHMLSNQTPVRADSADENMLSVDEPMIPTADANILNDSRALDGALDANQSIDEDDPIEVNIN